MSLISKGSRSAGHSRWHWGLYNSNMAARGLVAQLKGLCTLMVCVDPPPANQTHQASSTAAAAPPHLPADLDVPRFDRAGRRSVTGNQTCDSETHSFSYHGQVRVEIPSHPKNAEPFCSATVHLPLWDTHTHTHGWLTVWLCVSVCVCVDTHAHQFGSCDLYKDRERNTDQSASYTTCILSMNHGGSCLFSLFMTHSSCIQAHHYWFNVSRSLYYKSSLGPNINICNTTSDRVCPLKTKGSFNGWIRDQPQDRTIQSDFD